MGEKIYTEIASNLKFEKLGFFYCLYVKVKQGNCYQIGQAT